MFTVYNSSDDTYQLVEEPDPSLTYTYADYLQWKFEERVELIRGRIYKMCPAPSSGHQQVSVNLVGELYAFLKGKNCKLFSAPFDVRLPVKNKKKDNEVSTVVQPDVCIVCDETKIDHRGCLGAPDLIIEVLSPGNSKKEVKVKFGLYQGAGVKEYWVVYPAEENIAVFILNEKSQYDGAKIYASGDRIISHVVKGMSIEVDDIFGQ